MVSSQTRPLRVGDRVTIPWGLDEDVPATVVDVWGDPPNHVRVLIDFDDADDPVLLLLNPSLITRHGD